jgi:hypothetical protein
LRQVASGPRIYRVEPSPPGSGLVVVLGPADALRDPMPALDLGPLDLDAGVSLHDLAVVSMYERPGRPLLLAIDRLSHVRRVIPRVLPTSEYCTACPSMRR